MAIEIPGWLEPVLNFYGIPWPDIDEDAFHQLRQPLRVFGEDLCSFGNAIDAALRALETGNSSHSLRSITSYFQAIRADFLDPVTGVCDDLAGSPCDIAYEAVVAVKEGLLALLALEVGNDLLDAAGDVASLGTDTVLASGEAYAVREAVHEALIIGEGDVASAIMSATNQYIDNLVNSLVNPFINGVANRVEASVDSYAPQLLLRQAITIEQMANSENSSVADRLHISPSELDRCVQAIYESATNLDRASSKLDTAIEELFAHPAPSPQAQHLSSSLRIAVKGVVHTVEQDLIGALRQLVDHVVKHFGTLLEDYKRALGDLDQQARNAASNEHVGAGAAVTVLSAAGTGVAAGVAYASGIINAQESGRVQVETVSVVENAESLTVAAKTAIQVTEAPVASGDAAEHLHASTGTPAERLGAATASGGATDGQPLQAKRSEVETHVSQAAGVPESRATLGPRHDSERVRGIHDGSPAEPPASGDRLHVRRPDETRPRVDTATNTSHGVEEVAPSRTSESPHVDTSPAGSEAD